MFLLDQFDVKQQGHHLYHTVGEKTSNKTAK